MRAVCSGLWLALLSGCGSDGAAQDDAPPQTGTTGAATSAASTGATTVTNGLDSTATDDAGGTSSGSGSGPDADPEPTASQWADLQALRYDDGPPPLDVTNAWADDDAAAALGHALFFDPRFSGPLLDGDNDGSEGTLGVDGESHRVACTSCHVPADGFVDTRSPHQQISLAAGWVLRRTPTLLDVGFSTLLMWDGRRDAMHNILFGVLENPREFNSSRLYFAQQLHQNHRAAHEAVFGPMPDFADPDRFGTLPADQAGCLQLDAPAAACNGRPGDEGIYDGLAEEDRAAVDLAVVQASKALGAYMRRLRCGPSRFDAWLDGDADALSPAEKRGALLFVSQGECTPCHGGPMLSDFAFHNVGLLPRTVAVVFIDSNDVGASDGLAAALADPLNSQGPWSDGDDERLPATVAPSMLGAFKTPSLRCIESHPAFMHTGHMGTLADVVTFFNRGGDPAGFPGDNELHPLGLDPEQEADLVAFLAALAGPGPALALTLPPR